MSNFQQFPRILLPDVFKCLATGLSVNATVVTPNRRLALALKDQFDHFQSAQKLVVWDSADILSFSAFVERINLDAFCSTPETKWPMLLTTTQVRALWESVISNSDQGKLLLAIPQTAKLVHEAWQLAHAWRLIPKLKIFPQSVDSAVFLDWVQRFEHVTRKNYLTDDARLCDLIIESYEQLQIKKPARLICYGFDHFTPQQIDFFKKLEDTGCTVKYAQPDSLCNPHDINPKRIVCVDIQDEIYRVAVWARAIAERDQTARIGVVVPSLSKHRLAIMRVFSSVMEPDVLFALPGAKRQTLPFNVSLGVALTTYPLVNVAFQILGLVEGAIEFERASLLLRSPFLGGGETEMNNRALLDVQIRKRAEPAITLEQLLALVKQHNGEIRCPYLARQLTALAEYRLIYLQNLRKPSSWAKIFSSLLKLIGFPGERTLDSIEFQTLSKWHEVVSDFATLDNVVPAVDCHNAITRLRGLAADTLFQPETLEVPVQILGVLEADGMAFDHLWVMGLSEDEWPLRPRPNPFLPVGLQREAKFPMGSADESLAFSRRLTNRWFSCAGEVVCSHSNWHAEKKLKPSPLVKNIAETSLVLPVHLLHRDLIQQEGRLAYCEDYDAPALNDCEMQPNGVNIGGGAALIKDYAACPFRAFARHRLAAESLIVPHTGLNAMERGTLIHDVLAQIWRYLGTKAALDQANSAELERLITRAANSAIENIRKDRPKILSGRFAKIEQRRLVSLASEWLDEERKRDCFTIVATEEKRSTRIGGLILTSRLDRIDELVDGRRIIIDYKTQKPSIKTMLGERPDEPQLPLYLISAEPTAIAVAFAVVKTGGIGFIGIARDEDLFQGMKVVSDSLQFQQYESWAVLVESWHRYLNTLAEGFLGGNARVDPKNAATTCRYCDVQPLCRIYEKIDTTSPASQDEDV